MSLAQDDPLLAFIRRMTRSDDYLRMAELRDGCCYTLYARQAYVGVWMANLKGFLVSRYKFAPTPYLFVECHWDFFDECAGTAKPLALIEPFPYLRRQDTADYSDAESREILTYLDALEERFPVVPGISTRQLARDATRQFRERLRRCRENRGRQKTIAQILRDDPTFFDD